MAITHLQPAPEPDDSYLSKEEALAFLAESEWPVSLSTINRWIPLHRIHTRRRGRRIEVSVTGLLRAHRAWVDSREGAPPEP